MDLKTLALFAAMVMVLGFYLMRRRARLSQE